MWARKQEEYIFHSKSSGKKKEEIIKESSRKKIQETDFRIQQSYFRTIESWVD